MEKNQILANYNDFLSDFVPSKYINTEWKMKDGLYEHYSCQESSSVSTTANINTVKSL